MGPLSLAGALSEEKSGNRRRGRRRRRRRSGRGQNAPKEKNPVAESEAGASDVDSAAESAEVSAGPSVATAGVASIAKSTGAAEASSAPG